MTRGPCLFIVPNNAVADALQPYLQDGCRAVARGSAPMGSRFERAVVMTGYSSPQLADWLNLVVVPTLPPGKAVEWV